MEKKIIIINILILFFVCCNDHIEQEQIISLGSPLYNEPTTNEIKNIASQYDKIQTELISIVLNMSDKDLITIEKLNKLSQKGTNLKKITKNCSPGTIKKIYNEISKKPVTEEIINKIRLRYSNDSDFKKEYDNFVKSTTF
jgi:hypothetical protein